MDQETRKEFRKISDGFRKMATKDDLKNGFAKMATKDELKNSLEKMATKDDLKNGLENLAIMVKAGFDDVDKRFDSVATKGELNSAKKDIKVEINKHKLETQDFIADKVADVKGELVLLTRKEDKKLYCLVDKLGKKKVISPRDIAQLDRMKPFPRTVA
ncbi:MAG: hypothetical protein ABII72_00870 [Parcubacteria group bacterium]